MRAVASVTDSSIYPDVAIDRPRSRSTQIDAAPITADLDRIVYSTGPSCTCRDALPGPAASHPVTTGRSDSGRAHPDRSDIRPHPAMPRVDVTTMGPMFALSHRTGVTLAEVGFLLILFAGVWLVAAQIPAFKMPTARTIVAGIALALAGVLLIIATHWGHFG